MVDGEHHKGPSPLIDLPLDMIHSFPLDYMHLVCLGVMKRLLLHWVGKGGNLCRLPSRIVDQISEKLISLARLCPSEFARKPRSLNEVSMWKATEFRQFLLYTGMVVLHDLMDANAYGHFMLLVVAISLLADANQCKIHCDYAHSLLVEFVKLAKGLYGKEMLVYNVHNLIHLSSDVKLYGNLDSFSAFPFENHLGEIKKKLRKPQQAV
jgi:hypothetical protein